MRNAKFTTQITEIRKSTLLIILIEEHCGTKLFPTER